MEPYEEENNPKPAAEEGSILDKKPLRICGHPLTTRQQMWLGFMLPATISTIIFLADFAMNVAVAYQLLRDGHGLLGSMTMILVYAPAVTCLILTVVYAPKLKAKELAVWIVIQLLQTLAFPVGIMHRFASRLFWSIVALTEEDPDREQALQTAASSHQTEFFFLMDSVLNAGPQAVLQAYILLSSLIVTSDETAWTQAICFATSVITLSKTAALHQRFESQRIAGRPVLWISKQNEIHSRALVHFKNFDPVFLMGLHKSAKPKDLGLASLNKEHSENQETSTLKQQEDKHSQRSEPAKWQSKPEQLAELREQEVSTAQVSLEHECDSTNDLTTVDRHNYSQEQDSLLIHSSTCVSNENSFQDQEPLKIGIKPIEDLCFWPRLATPPTSPTADPHMCPRLSINTIRSQNRPAYTSHVRFHVHKPRTKGLYEDEPLGIFTAFIAWLPYLTARILVLAAFSNLYVWASLGLIMSHYSIMVSYLCFCSPCKNPWMPLLGFIYILLPIEVNVQYKYPRVFLVMFFALVFLENLGTGILWYYGTVHKNWWHDFTFYFIFGCQVVAALNAALYLFMFKPKVKYVE